METIKVFVTFRRVLDTSHFCSTAQKSETRTDKAGFLTQKKIEILFKPGLSKIARKIGSANYIDLIIEITISSSPTQIAFQSSALQSFSSV